jgi:hypothetical protein
MVKAVPLQAWSVPEGSRNLRFPDYITTAKDGGNVALPHIHTPTHYKTKQPHYKMCLCFKF